MKSKKPNEFFSKLFLYGTIEIVIIIVIVASTLFYAFRGAQLSEIYRSSTDSLSQVSYSANFMVDSAKSLLVQMYYDDNISNLRFKTDLDTQDILTDVRLLANYSYSMPFVDSIYIYNKNNDTFYTTLTNTAAVKSSAFFDKDIINILNNSKDISVAKPIARNVAFSSSQAFNKQTTNVFTFIYPQYNSNNLDNAIIINVSELWIRKVISSLNLDKSDKIIIVDSKGDILSSIFNNEIQSNLSKNLDYNFIKDITGSSGHITFGSGGTKSLVTYVSANNLDWKYIRVMPYSRITGLLNQVRDTTLLICFIILFFGLALSFVFSKSIYKPINDVINNLKNRPEDIKDIRALREEYLKALLLDEINFVPLDFKKNSVEFNINLNPDAETSIILFKIDHFFDFCNTYNCCDRSTLKFGIINIASEIIETSYKCEGVDIGKDHIAIIINEAFSSEDETLTTLYTFIRAIQLNVSKCLNISLSCTIGPANYGLSTLSKLYSETYKLSFYRTFYGFNSIIYNENLNINKDYVYPMETEKALIDALLVGKLEDAKKLYEVIINQDFANCSYAQFDSTLLRLAFSISSAIETIEKAQHLNIEYNFSFFIGKLNALETLSEIKSHFFSMFDEISVKLEKKKVFKYEDLIHKIMGIINSQYMNPSICLDSIAESVDMSSVYLGRLFKKNTMKSVSDYINEVRMAHAIEYLKATDMSINDIVEKVGFSNRSYFHTLFKKEYAATPNDYRKNFQNDSVSSS